MSTDGTAAMQEALQAAVKRMNGGGAEAPTAPTDLLGLVASLLPRLIAGGQSREEVLDKLDGLQKEDIGSLREQVRVLRKRLRGVSKAQALTLAKLDEVYRQQTAVTEAVLELAAHMGRLQIIDPSSEQGARGHGPPPGSGDRPRARPATERNGADRGAKR